MGLTGGSPAIAKAVGELEAAGPWGWHGVGPVHTQHHAGRDAGIGTFCLSLET